MTILLVNYLVFESLGLSGLVLNGLFASHGSGCGSRSHGVEDSGGCAFACELIGSDEVVDVTLEIRLVGC